MKYGYCIKGGEWLENKEFVDLLSIGDIDEIKKIDTKADKVQGEKQEKVVEKIKDKDNKDNIEDITKEELDTPMYQKKRRYIEYLDGRFLYHYSEGEGLGMKDKIKQFLSKESGRRDIAYDFKNNFDFKKNANKMLTILLILSMIFVYYYYIRNDSSDKDNLPIESTQVQDGNQEEQKHEEEKKDTDKSMGNIFGGDKDDKNLGQINGVDTSELSAREMAYNYTNMVDRLSEKEDEKVLKYMDLKGNKKALESTIIGVKREKENIYMDLNKNKDLFKDEEELYENIEGYIVKEIARSNDFLDNLNGASSSYNLETIVNN